MRNVLRLVHQWLWTCQDQRYSLILWEFHLRVRILKHRTSTIMVCRSIRNSENQLEWNSWSILRRLHTHVNRHKSDYATDWYKSAARTSISNHGKDWKGTVAEECIFSENHWTLHIRVSDVGSERRSETFESTEMWFWERSMSAELPGSSKFHQR